VNLLPDAPAKATSQALEQIRGARGPGERVLASIHWGGNWGYEVPGAHKELAHRLVDEAGVDVVHGHSSHHRLGIEVYRGRLVLYGCGDLLNDYEGIRGYEHYRAELGFMYFLRLQPASGRLLELRLTPTRIRHLRIERAAPDEAQWLAAMLNREGAVLGTGVTVDREARLTVHWREGAAA
jgi:poly-gamma-glutamate synthesis protein (capsule biosynthesis protein)